jgi:hypothetical protein
MNSKKAFADQLRSLPNQNIKKKKSTISMIEIPDEDATPKFERLSNDEESILIAVNELPNEYEEMLALVPDTEDDEEEQTEGDLVSAYLQGETIETTPKPEQKEPLNQPIQIDSDIAIRAKMSISQSLAHEAETGEKKSFEELVPKEYHEFQSVFEKKTSEQFPEKRPWDHRIDLKPDFKPFRSKQYPLNQREEEMNKFTDDNLKKKFIHESSSPQASPFFFISKKDSQAL